MMNFNRLLATQNKHVVSLAFRNFGPKAKAGGGAPAAAPYVEPSRMKTNFEVMVEKNGIDQFMFGPPAGIEKMHNSHRAYVIPKLGSRMEFFAKKMREQYIREAIYPDVKIFLDYLRLR